MTAGLRFLELNVSDSRSCISVAKQFSELEERLDVLIANAALSVVVSRPPAGTKLIADQTWPETLSSDGIEIQFGVCTLQPLSACYLADNIADKRKGLHICLCSYISPRRIPIDAYGVRNSVVFGHFVFTHNFLV